MTQEEKARAYDEALKRADSLTEKYGGREFAEYVFPELAESEDERIRKKIIENVRLSGGYTDEEIDEMISWLERQKEQKVDIDKLRRDLYQSGYNDGYQHGKEDAQKEQKPAEWSDYKDKVNVPYCSSEPEWSEENERIYNKALDAIYYKDLNDKDEVVDSLKALWDLIARKRKVIPPYAHWKPSEEQMEALKCAVEDVAKFSKRGGRQVELENEPYYSALHSLYCNLEKLM